MRVTKAQREERLRNPLRGVDDATAIADPPVGAQTAPSRWRYVLKLECGHFVERLIRWHVREGEPSASVRCVECGALLAETQPRLPL